MSLIRIDKGVPVPPKKTPNEAKYPWRDMEVGDSIRVPGTAQPARRSASLYGNASGKRFTARKVGKHTRIWRIR